MNTKCDSTEPIRIRVDPEIASLVPGFLDNRRKDITSILEAIEQSDFETVRVLGHSMKGSGGGYGFDAITDIGHGIESASKQRDSQAVRQHVAALSTYLARVLVESDETET